MFFFLCVVAQELFSAINDANVKFWYRKVITLPHDDKMATPAIQDMATAADILSLTTTAATEGNTHQSQRRRRIVMIFVVRGIAVQLLAGITAVAERSGGGAKTIYKRLRSNQRNAKCQKRTYGERPTKLFECTRMTPKLRPAGALMRRCPSETCSNSACGSVSRRRYGNCVVGRTMASQ
jgi:hypothetical protein